VRNAFRNSIRTLSIVLILGLSVGLSLAMLVARQAVQNKISSVKSSVGNTITVSPAGARGFQGGGEPLTTAQISEIKNIAHVASVAETLSDRLTSTNTNLSSAIEAGSLGQRGAENSGVSMPADANPPSISTSSDSSGASNISFTPPVTVTGTNVLDNTVYGGTSVSYTSGKAFDPTVDSNVAVVGKALATKNSLSVGSTFTTYGSAVTVVGIYDAGNTFANSGLIMPLVTVQRLSNQTGDVTSVTVTVDSVDNLAATTKAITSAMGSAADVVSSQDMTDQVITPLENIKTISLFSVIGAVIAGSVIILLTMVMIVRERRREIGVLKAIGASNTRTTLQFVSEAITLTLLGMVVGVVFGAISANPITKTLVNNSANSSSTQTTQARGQGSPSGGGFKSVRSFGSNSVTNLKSIQASVGWDILLYGFGAAVLIAVIGSAIPALLISKVRPAEVMRAE
jgi:putative ABC transport system permease protein